MDGINGITAGYSTAVLLPLMFVNREFNFIDASFLSVTLSSVIVFSFFNFRPRGKAKCFAGDVGSVGMAFILLFAIGALIAKTGDITWLIFLLVYGVDGCLTICHRYISDTQQCRSTLDIFIMCFRPVMRYIHIIQEEILPFARRIFNERIKKMILVLTFTNNPDFRRLNPSVSLLRES